MAGLTAHEFKIQAFEIAWRAFSALSDVQELIGMNRPGDATDAINEIKRRLNSGILNEDPDLHRDIVAGLVRFTGPSADPIAEDIPIDGHLDDDSILERWDE